MNKRSYGTQGELDARDFLRSTGYCIRTMNYKALGAEIDVIAEKNGVVAFIEVKRRTDARYGRPIEAVTPQKMRQIVRAAGAYVQANRLEDTPLRFDVIEIMSGEIRHIEGAFDASDF